MKRYLIALLAVGFALASCSSDAKSSPASEGSAATVVATSVAASTTAATTTMPGVSTTSVAPATTVRPGPVGDVLNVPADYPTIQKAVDSAKPGALILISPGTYHEAVNVTTDNLTIRGLDRNTVILDGQLKLDNGVRVLGAKGVTVENMTATNYTSNGFFWTGVTGYHGSYLTAYRTGDYGVYAFDSSKGQLDHVYAAGSPDAGVYIGECFPCDAVIDRIVSEHNGLGYSGTNSGGNLLVINSVFRFNRAGIVPNSGSYELCYPERQTTIVGNVVYSNNQADTPAIDVALLAMGNGIIPAGGVLNVIERNRVYDHDKGGISLVPFLENDPNDALPDPSTWTTSCAESKTRPVTEPAGPILWDSQQNRVIGNVLENNRVADILVASLGDVSTLGNCFADNGAASSFPKNIEKLAPCDAKGSGDWNDGKYDIASWLSEVHPPSVDWQTATLPPLQPQEQMPDAATAPAHPATNVPEVVNLDDIKVPDKPVS
ncbi:MAG: right-handed parallel beta-helix repeat-containing protein [Ilumatobacteraceae bacterium]